MVELTIEQLFLAGYKLETPFCVLLPGCGTVKVEAILRILPARRLVAKGSFSSTVNEGPGGRTTTQLVKIFQERAHWQQEINGHQMLEKTGVNTPGMLSHQMVADGGVVCYEYLDNLESAEIRWQHAKSEAEKMSLLQQLLLMLSQLYRAGLRQRDLHLNNFVFQEQRLYALDPADCIPLKNDDDIRHNLAIFLTQLPLADWDMAIPHIVQHAPATGGAGLRRQAYELWLLRKKHYLKKIFRDCTDVVDLSRHSCRALCKRNVLSGEFMALLDNPDAAIAAGEIIKDGQSSTVAKVKVGNAAYVVKRYHNKNKLTALRRRFSKNRARNNWYFAHLLEMAGIGTPRPVAMLNHRWSFLNYSRYYISEYIPADNAFNVFVRTPPSRPQLQQVQAVFNVLDAMNVKHGDCKSTNWLVGQDRVWLVDLDAMCEIKNHTMIDRERFLRDWQNHPALLAQFESALVKKEKG